jgi:hypothetical protein
MLSVIERFVSLLQPLFSAYCVKRGYGYAVATGYRQAVNFLCLHCAAGSLSYGKRFVGRVIRKYHRKLFPSVTVSKPFALNDLSETMADLF